MTIEEVKDAQDIIINKLMGIRGLLDILPHSFEQNGYDINAKVVVHCDETIKEMVDKGQKRIKEIGEYLHSLKATE